MYKVSVIMPAYNAQDTIATAIYSVLDTPQWRDIEIVVVDDCSQDSTLEVVMQLQQQYPNIKLYQMPSNSGGPSGPRNMGIEKATAEYVTFLDDDDRFDSCRFLQMVEHARKEDLEFLKGYLIVVHADSHSVYNRLPEVPTTTWETVYAIMGNQSTNSDFLVKRSVLTQHGLRYSTGLKIGEDTVFTAQILVHCSKARYIDNYFMYHTIGSLDVSNVSSTQKCGDREINDQITAWEQTQSILSYLGIDYYKIRLHTAVRNLLLSIVRYSEGISPDTFARLSTFAQMSRQTVRGKMNLHSRYQELYEAILSGDYKEYCAQAKPRLLIAGYDLKFVLPLVPYLTEWYHVEVDEWGGHDSHNEKRSKAYVRWADIIWCEWLLGNAVFYTKHKNANQRLVIRAHRFEITRDFGCQVDYDKVDMFLTVGYYYMELFQKQFLIPRKKMRLLVNYVEEHIYSTEKTPEARFHLGLVGILPARKGFHRGLELLRNLREQDPRYKLYVMGKAPHELSWIRNNPAESSYFDRCEAYIKEHHLEDAVVFGGFVQRENLYKEIGYVLSLSDNELPESFHLAPAEGACAGSMGLLLRWPGVEYIYPQQVLYNTIEEMISTILRAGQDGEFFQRESDSLRTYVLEHYGIDSFLHYLQRYLKQLFILE